MSNLNPFCDKIKKSEKSCAGYNQLLYIILSISSDDSIIDNPYYMFKYEIILLDWMQIYSRVARFTRRIRLYLVHANYYGNRYAYPHFDRIGAHRKPLKKI